MLLSILAGLCATAKPQGIIGSGKVRPVSDLLAASSSLLDPVDQQVCLHHLLMHHAILQKIYLHVYLHLTL